MNEKLELIKAALRKSLELAESASPGPWTNEDDGENRKRFVTSNKADIATTIFEPNAAFIAHVRTFHPLAVKALLTAIDWMQRYNPSCEESFYQVDSVNEALPELGIAMFNALETIIRDLEETKP